MSQWEISNIPVFLVIFGLGWRISPPTDAILGMLEQKGMAIWAPWGDLTDGDSGDGVL